jgi:ubiquinone/menaquinone biosynthesis C-methylase UbiE
MDNRKKKTSWEGVSRWYDDLVGQKGHFYHQEVILPQIKEHLKQVHSVLDICCGQGVVSRHLPEKVEYCGIDIAPSLIEAAKKFVKNPKHRFFAGDATKKLPIEKNDFDIALLILCMQDLENIHAVFKNAYEHLAEEGKLLIVLNHPCFRIPRQSSWEVDDKAKIRYRRLNRYLNPLTIPIFTKPSLGNKSPSVNYFHRSLSDYSQALKEAGFKIELIDEWVSPKKSTGSKAAMEDRAREEFPLFLFIKAERTKGPKRPKGPKF